MMMCKCFPLPSSSPPPAAAIPASFVFGRFRENFWENRQIWGRGEQLWTKIEKREKVESGAEASKQASKQDWKMWKRHKGAVGKGESGKDFGWIVEEKDGQRQQRQRRRSEKRG